ncbi:MAG TPA: ferredoxin--NADP reductase [Kofleriaceae bacterium]|nr:ferredoxin--NADP reductase [Kofleriaceae bacterium]
MLVQLRRDLRSLFGPRPSPLIKRPPSPHYPATGASDSAARARTLEVVDVTRETADAVTLTLRDPAGAAIPFVPGQFFTLIVALGDDAPLRRAYSASSSHLDPSRVTITVKRVEGGRVSSHLVDTAAVGMRLAVLGPSGDFTLAPDAAAARHVVAIAGGSGITPILSITRAVLDVEPASRVTLLYGNRDAASIIFAHELDALVAASAGRLVVRHVLEDASGRPGANTGRLDAATVAAELDACRGCDAGATYYVCGPEAMMAEARTALLARAVTAANIREERFSSPARRQTSVAPTTQPVTIRRAGVALDVIVRAGDTILDAGLAAGVPLRLSCAMGGCGECAVKLTAGDVAMDEPNCLSDAERAGGKILACVARPLTPCTVEAP